MIQIDTNSPETGQAATQGLRNSGAEQNGEDPIEFAQIWSEFTASETPKAAPSPTLSQSDADTTRAVPDSEAAEVQPQPHFEKSNLIERTGIQSANDGPPKLPSNAQSDPRAHQFTNATQAPFRTPILGEGRSDVVQALHVRQQLVLPTEQTETSIPANTIAKAGAAPTPPSMSETATAHAPSMPSGAVLPTNFDARKQNGQLERQSGSEQAPVQTVARDKNSNDPPPVAGLNNQTATASTLTANPTVQTSQSAATPDPFQATAQRQNAAPDITLPPQDQSKAPQTFASPNPASLSKPPPLAASPLPKSDLSNLMSNAVAEIELPASQPTHTNAANAQTPVSQTTQHHAPQIASQIGAAISQSSNTTTEILLNPEELGRVRISLTNGDAGMTVNILAERSETVDLMRRNIELLARELRDMGYDNPSFTFGERTDGSNDAWEDEHPEPTSESPRNTTESPPPIMHVTLTGGLDLKL
ncbi:MAG: flagellar hook-length control protein FliK [Octadecabacter sp.]